jgi:hypothetical protein
VLADWAAAEAATCETLASDPDEVVDQKPELNIKSNLRSTTLSKGFWVTYMLQQLSFSDPGSACAFCRLWRRAPLP